MREILGIGLSKIIGKKNYFKQLVLEYLGNKKLQKFCRENPLSLGQDSSVVLIWELGGFTAILERNIIFSLALQARDKDSCFMVCDGTSEICVQHVINKKGELINSNKSCEKCFNDFKCILRKYGRCYSCLGNYISEATKNEFKDLSNSIKIKDISKFIYKDVNVGVLALASLNRAMLGAIVNINSLTTEKQEIYRKFFYASLINTHVADEIIKKFSPTGVLTSHGEYVDYGPAILVSYNLGVKSCSWSSGFKKHRHSFLINHPLKNIFKKPLILSGNKKVKSEKLSDKESNLLENLINDRYFNNKADYVKYKANENKPVNLNELYQKFCINKNQFIACLFTNVSWDSYDPYIFESANEWVIQSINKMIEKKNVVWIIRIHPVESGAINDGSIFSTDDLIKENYPILPDHIKVIWSDSKVNAYSLFQFINVGITIEGTVGTELPLLGKPIISANYAHFSGKGFSIDFKSRREYFSILADIEKIKSLSSDQIESAKKYAYSFFFQQQIPMNFMDKSQDHWSRMNMKNLDILLPGKDVAMDRICSGIINGDDITLD
jgi:hypothetical protein